MNYLKRKNNKDLQPWLDYFKLLQKYEEKGYLEVMADKHEAYVTRAAFLLLLGLDETSIAKTAEQPTPQTVQLSDIADLLQRIRVYAGFRSQQGEQYLDVNFALHVVKDDVPHDLLCTFLLTKKRNWLGRKKEHVEIISYGEVKSEK